MRGGESISSNSDFEMVKGLINIKIDSKTPRNKVGERLMYKLEVKETEEEERSEERRRK
jgi:hypothetical protein